MSSSSPFQLHVPKALDHCFQKIAGARAWFTSVTVVLGQPAGLSKEVCLYAGADWLQLVGQSESGERSDGLQWNLGHNYDGGR